MSRYYISRVVSLILLLNFFSCEVKKNEHHPEEIRLVLQITIDGLRADLIERYQDRFIEGGFNYLLKNGAVYNNAHYQHANTETIVGHTTLATGTIPAVHGMIGNVWYDRTSGELGYNIEDPDALIIPSRDNITEGTQVDPSQLAARTKGRSPKAILTSTISDEIFKSSAGQAKIYGVSGKDRSAVAMAGHTGKAFWYSADNGDFVTSKYYYNDYPDWVNDWNGQRMAENMAGYSWELLNELSTYKFKDQDDRPYERDLMGYGKVFPHPFGKVEDPLLATRIIVSPYGDKLTLDFAKSLIVNEEIGKDDVVDYLSISFSGVDAVNHFFGPSSLENEDVILQLDHTLKDLLSFINEHIGLNQTLIVMSADHGMAEMPEYMSELGYDVGRIYSEDVITRVNEIGLDLYGIHDVAKAFFRPSLYLDNSKIKMAGLIVEDVEKAIAVELMKMEGISLAIARGGLCDMDKSPIYDQIKNNFHPSRSGDIYVAQEPYWFLFEKGAVVVMHGSPWNYDTHVPIIFAGPSIKPSSIQRLVHPVDIAPTIASKLGINTPASSVGNILREIFN